VREAEESPLLESAAMERLVKAKQAGKMFSGCRGDLRIEDHTLESHCRENLKPNCNWKSTDVSEEHVSIFMVEE
jgi:hypothetical protein